MKVDRSKLKKSSSEVPADCKVVIETIKGLSQDDLLKELKEIKTWTFGKCELYHWADVLDIFDGILEKACQKETDKKWTLLCDLPGNEQLKQLMLEVLRFTALLIEHSFSRHLYNSMDHLTTLLTSCDMSAVLYVLNLLYVFSKRSNFISRMGPEKKQGLIQRLVHLAESWGGKENGFGLAECCQDLPKETYPHSATTLHFEFYAENKDDKNKKAQTHSTLIQSIHMENVDKTSLMPSQIMEEIMASYDVPEEKQIVLFTHVRLACLFSNYEARVHCVQARLQAISILVYSIAMQDNMNVILYPGLIEELVDIVEIKGPALVDIKSAALRTLTSVIHIERNPRLTSIIDATGASSYHGFLPVLVRTCIQHMIDPTLKPFPQTYATSLFSFLYHLASYENGLEALVSCGMMESLLKVINWYGDGQEHITFVTRAVRVIDLITNMDMAAFQGLGGLQAFINRLEHEVNLCREEQPFEIMFQGCDGSMESDASPMDMSSSQAAGSESGEWQSTADMMVRVSAPPDELAPPPSSNEKDASSICASDKKNRHCFAQRAALLKSMLNFMKKAIPDMSFAESIRHLMDGSLPKSLKHIISNAEYYGPSLFLLATDVVTVYVFQEPSLLSSLQDKGLTDVVLHALLVKDVPATREVLASLPNVFSALCLNARGLEAFVACKPFDRLFKVLLSPDYLPAMRRRRSSDPFGDTASNLGNAMDELMRHQPSLRTDATKAIIKLLEEICAMGQDPHFICQKQQPKTDATSAQISVRSPQSNEASSSDEEDEEEVEMPHMPPSITATTHLNVSQTKASTSHESMQANERQAIPLMDYVLNVMKFVEAILSNNSTDDHCREFVLHKGLKPLMSILGLPNLPIDFPSSPACQAVSSVCKSVLTLSREPQVLKQGLLQMNEVLHQLQPLHQPLEAPGGSVLLRELANCAHISDATLSSTATPLLHSLAAAHAYIMMFVHVCRMGQTDIRTISVNHWGSDLGLEVLRGLSSLYNSLVWESTVLLALCNEDYLPPDCQFGRVDLEKLLTKDAREKGESGDGETVEDKPTNSMNEGAPQPSSLQEQQAAQNTSMQMETACTGEECMDTSEIGAVAQPEVSATCASSSSLTESSSLQSTQGDSITQREGGAQSLNLPFTGVTTSNSSASIDSDNMLGAAGPTGVSQDKDPKKKVSPAMQAQLRQLKPLLTLSSRLGRALSELFVLLVKLSVGSPVRQRRSQPASTPTIPSPAARDVALALTKLLAGGLSFKPPAYSPQPKLRMTFLVCSAGFTAPMLFDEKKQPYHLMMQKFVACGGQAALFQSFSWALSMDGKVPLSEGLEHPDLPEGTGEFLESWLNLVEKMISPKTVLESPHTLPPKGKAPGLIPFNPVQYLISTQKAAFNAVMNLWNKTPLTVHGARISESVLAILCHIICGENILKKHIEKEKAAAASGTGDSAVDLSGAGPSSHLGRPGAGFANLTNILFSGGSGGTAGRNSGNNSSSDNFRSWGEGLGSLDLDQMTIRVNLRHLSQLMDMGFTRQQASAALTNTSSLEQATEYILTHPIPTTSASESAGGSGSADVEMDEEGQIMKAIAMSLGQNAIMSTDQPKSEDKDKKNGAENVENQEDDEPLDSSVLDEFTLNIFPGCLKLLDTLPETVYRVCDLLIVVMYRNGKQWKKDTLASLCAEICGLSKEMTTYAEENSLSKMLESDSAQKFATRLHLLSLLAEEMNQCVATVMHQSNLPSMLTSLLVSSKSALVNPTQEIVDKSKLTPKWLAPLLLLLDMWEKISVGIKRKIQARIIVGGNRVWKWFDDSSGRWCKYSTSNNNTIDEAFKKGDSFVRFQAGRRKYSVQFGTMIQLNEETGNRRPVMLSMPTAEEKVAGKKEVSKDTVPNEQFPEEVFKDFEVPNGLDNFLPGFTPDVIHTIISVLSSYLIIPLAPDCLHATMRLILRLTREHQYAEQFVCEGGAQRLLSLTVESNFQGFINLATLIFRHILEEPVSLRYCMEKVMRNVCGMGSCRSGVSQGGLGSKEMHYILRMLGPAACRNPELFSRVAMDTLQITLIPSVWKDNDDARYGGLNAPLFLRCTPTKQLESLVNPWIKNFIWDLLNALIVSNIDNSTPQNKSKKALEDNMVEVLQDFVSECQCRPSQGSNQAWPNTANALSIDKDNAVAAKDPLASTPEESNASSKQLIPKSAILRLLSEIIRSYGNCVQLITQHTYQPNQANLVTESCSVLAFVLDNLLCSCQNVGDKDCPALSRVFIASIASCSLSPDSQMALVTEVKGALHRALALPEGSAKHQRLQALSSIISTMIESCHTPGQIQNQFFKGQQVINNNMMKILVKKGMLVDLARIPHNLDLSSPFLAATVNSILKPLETLSRSVNSPDKFVPIKKGSDQSTAPDQGGTTTQVVSEPAVQENNGEIEASQSSATDGAEMNVTIEDVTNDLDAQNNLEVTTDHHIAEPESFSEDRVPLDDVLSQLLHTTNSADSESQVLTEMTISQVAEPTTVDDEHEILIDVEVEGDEDDYDNGHHGSQMVSQVLSDEEDDADDGDNDRDPDNPDDVSGDDEDYDEADQEEMGDDDDEEDEEEEDEDEEDEEASELDGEGEGDGLQEIRNPFDTDDMIFPMDNIRFRRRQGEVYISNTRTQMHTMQLPLNMADNDAANDASPSLPPTPSLITNSHPLLMRQQDSHASRAHRSGRSRLRPITTAHVNLNSTTRPANTLLQRLLGPSTAAEILQLTSTLSSQNPGGGAPSRVVVAGENLPFLQRPEDDSFIEEIFQDSDDGPSGSGVLSCIPSTLTRWTEETKVLDGDGVHDLVTILKPPLVEELVKKRDVALEERKEKEKKKKIPEVTASAESKTENSENEASVAASEKSGTDMEGTTETALATSSDAAGNNQTAEMLASAIIEQVLSPMFSGSQSESISSTTSTTTTATTAVAPGTDMRGLSSYTSFLEPLTSESQVPSVPFTTTSSLLSQPAPMPPPDQPMTVITQLPPAPSSFSIPSTTSQAFNWQISLPNASSTPLLPTTTRPDTNNPVDMDVLWGSGTGTDSACASALTTTTTATTQDTSISTSIISQLLDNIISNSSSTPAAINEPVFTTQVSSATQPISVQGQAVPSAIPAVPGVSQMAISSQGQGNPGNVCWPFMRQFRIMTQTTSPSTTTTAVSSQAGQPSAVNPTTSTNSSVLQPSQDTSLEFATRYPCVTAQRVSDNPPQDTSLEFAARYPYVTPRGSGPPGQDTPLEFAARYPYVTSQRVSSHPTQDTSLEYAARYPYVTSQRGSGHPAQDMDFSVLLSQAQMQSSSGVTGATPPLSNLSFGSTSSQPMPTSDTVVMTPETAITTSSSGITATGSAEVGGSGTQATSSSSTRPEVAAGDPEVPEGVDPSFLAALPDHIRQEVISEQLRLQRIRRRAEEQAQASVSMTNNTGGESSNVMEVNPEFLAALPPAIQEEVLAQQRAEQARLVAQQTTTNPDMPVDPATFFSTLPSSLRQQVLSDMDDSMLAVLPPELLTEAQELRRNMEERHRRRLQEPSLIGFLRDCGLASRLGTRFAIRAAQRQSSFNVRGGSGVSAQNKIKGRFMLDPEALTCLLVLLFIDDPKLNTARLHKVFRNLCYHGPTRSWLIRALISIIQKAGDTGSAATSALCVEEKSSAKDKGKGKKLTLTSNTVPTSTPLSSSFNTPNPSVEASSTAPMQMDSSLQGMASSTTPSSQQRASSSGLWLSISLEAALGCRANVFQIHRPPGKKSSSSSALVSIHPQAAPVVCRHTLDTLISLAKSFPSHFLPVGKAKEVVKCDGKKEEENEVPKKLPSQPTSQQSKSSDVSSASSTATTASRDVKSENDFWNILVRLDNASGKSKGKGVQRSHSMVGSEGENAATDYSSSALGQLMGMLRHPVVRRSQLLTDRLLRLLGLISVSLPDNSRPSSSALSSTTTTTATTATTRTNMANTATTNATSTTTSLGMTTQTTALTNTTPTTANVGVTAEITEDKLEEEGDNLTNKPEDIDDGQPILQEELRLAVEVLTSKSCSEEGLEDATNLLLELSFASHATRVSVLNLLLSGARQLGLLVCGHIEELLEQLSKLNSQTEGETTTEDRNNPSATGEEGSTSSSKQVSKGVMADRFSSGTSVVVSAPTALKTGRELHLPSMSQLTSKSSSQHFFLRILKVIIQLRDAARTAGLDMKGFRNRTMSQEINFVISHMMNDGSSLPVMPAAMGPASSTSQTMENSQSNLTSESLQPEESAMEVDVGPGASKIEDKAAASQHTLPRLSDQLTLDQLWDMLGECLAELARTPDHHAVLILQPAVEAFFIVHAGEKLSKSSEQPSTQREDQLAHLNLEMAPPSPAMAGSGSSDGASAAISRDSLGFPTATVSHLPADTQKFLKFAETHRTVLNQILRQSTLPLSDGPFSVLVDHMRILDFDVKRRYFRQELERLNEGARREDLPVHVRRSNVFEDSFRELFRRSPEEWKQRFYIVFEGEEGQDAGGLLREWYIIISHEIFNQNYALFQTSPGDRVTYTISPSSHCNSNHLSYFKFVGRIIAKAVYDNKLLDCYFTRSFYKHMLGLAVKYTDMESEDYAFYQGLHFMLENSVVDLGYDLYFSTEVQEFGVTETRELMPDGTNILVTEDNKREYVKRVCQMKMTGAIRQQLNAFLEGFYDIIPKKLVSIFTEQELELLISGLPTIDIDDLKGNTEYIKYQATSLQIQWFWRALRSFDQAERANFLQFVTGTSKVPLGGFANLEGMNGTQKFQIHRDDRSTDRLPSAHTCFNQLDLPAYETYDKLRKMLLLAVNECSEGFGLA